MTAIARRIAATPVRSSAETWAFVVDLIAAANNDMRPVLENAGDTASMLIAEEHTAADPIVLSACGPQVRIYTLHSTAAIDGANEASLAIIPTSDWKISLPATGVDYDIAAAALAAIDRVDVYRPTDTETHSVVISTKTRVPADIDLSVLEN